MLIWANNLPIEIVYCIKHMGLYLRKARLGFQAWVCFSTSFGQLWSSVQKYVWKSGLIEIEIVSAGIVSEESRVLGFKLESGHRPTRPEERTSESDSESVAPLHVSLNYMCELRDFSPLCVFWKWVFKLLAWDAEERKSEPNSEQWEWGALCVTLFELAIGLFEN